MWGVNVRDLAAARAFFLDLGLEVAGEGALEGEWLDRIVALEGVRTGFVMLRTPNGQSTVELITYTMHQRMRSLWCRWP